MQTKEDIADMHPEEKPLDKSWREEPEEKSIDRQRGSDSGEEERYTEHVNGDVEVRGDAKVRGRFSAEGSGQIGGNLTVHGWLNAPNIKGINKGIFISEADLQRTYPYPYDGWLAGVGRSTPFAAYVGRCGKWVATGGTLDLNVDMSIYTDAVREMQLQMAELLKEAPIARITQQEYDRLKEDELIVEKRFYFIVNEDDVVYRIYIGSMKFSESEGGITFPFTFPFTFAS